MSLGSQRLTFRHFFNIEHFFVVVVLMCVFVQVYMYQLTRLLAETQPTLYRQLDRLEVDPSLYSTPWFLTLFAAHFPLGFVTRVFDLLLLEGPHAIIKVKVRCGYKGSVRWGRICSISNRFFPSFVHSELMIHQRAQILT